MINIGIKKPTQKKEVPASAVSSFYEELERFHSMKAEWAERFPEAASELAEVKRQEDLTYEARDRAKEEVRQLKEDVEDFRCQRKFSPAGYDAEAMFKIIRSEPDGFEVLDELVEDGVISGIKLRENAASWIAGKPAISQLFGAAWKDKKEITPAIFVPDI